MPEGPEVHRQADQIRKAIGGKLLTGVSFGLDRLEAHGPRMVGRRVEDVEARGKAFLIRIEDGETVYVHLQLYGRWVIRKTGKLPTWGRQLRALFEVDGAKAALYSASEIEVLEDDVVDDHPYLAKLGPDILDPTLSASVIAERLGSKTFRRRQLAGTLLDQSALGGVGNYLRSEILFVAGLRHDLRPVDLNEEDLHRLGEAVLTMGRRSYATGGVTNDPDCYDALRAEGVPRRRARHFVFARASRPCFVCGTPIERIDAAGRRLYRCPTCQP